MTKKKDPRTFYDLALSDISETKIPVEHLRLNFIHFMEQDHQPILRVGEKRQVPMNQTWSLPDRTYTWFPYFMMYISTK